jgi:hypothetical protein
MSMRVLIEDDLYNSAREQAKAEHRTIAGQIEFWVELRWITLICQLILSQMHLFQWLNLGVRPLTNSIQINNLMVRNLE